MTRVEGLFALAAGETGPGVANGCVQFTRRGYTVDGGTVLVGSTISTSVADGLMDSVYLEPGLWRVRVALRRGAIVSRDVTVPDIEQVDVAVLLASGVEPGVPSQPGSPSEPGVPSTSGLAVSYVGDGVYRIEVSNG